MSKMPKDMQQIMQQAQQMQQQMMAAQEALAHKTFEGTAGGGAVKAVIKGTGELLSVDFEASVLDPDDPEMAGDLVVAAVNQAMVAMSADADSNMGGLAGGLSLGGMLG
ncbi:MAG: YbaB/EbfC family nucleoid-associated protein [Acidimicrobiia bacterium]